MLITLFQSKNDYMILPIVFGNLYRQVINDCYKNNLLISNKMKADGNIIDLKMITALLLTIVAENDDLIQH